MSMLRVGKEEDPKILLKKIKKGRIQLLLGALFTP
jgi:hypothetical protein